ncbi:MAG: hypothetical protein K2M65_00420 [Muribaculaceae bacterium]|nr:hypothetical protein [Muribaculaceae bacterium]
MASLSQTITNWKERITQMLHSSQGKDCLIFLLFLLVSYVFWLLLTLNNEIQEDINVRLEVSEIPDSVTIISDIPPTLSVSVRDKGSTLVRYHWGTTPSLKLPFTEYMTNDNRFVVTETEIDSRLRAMFGQSGQIISAKPDSISAFFTSQPGRKVRLELLVEAHPTLQCVISGPILANVDSVTIYSINDLPSSIKSAETQPIVRTDLSDTTWVEARIKPIAGTRIVPDHVRVCIPVEPLIAKTRLIPVNIVGVPKGIDVLTFPSKVKISYLIPMSLYSVDNELGYAMGDYESLITESGLSSKLALHPAGLPDFYHNISLDTDSVEYIIEHKP